MRWAVIALAALVAVATDAAIVRAAPVPVPEPRPAPAARSAEAPFGAGLPAGHTRYSNESLAELFVALTHELEWGGRRPHLVRYEAPVRVGVLGRGGGRYREFLDGYLAELRLRAGVPIALTPPPHNLLVRFVPGDEFRSRLPRHYCAMAPGRPDWGAFVRNPRRHGVRPFESATAIGATTVFIPDDAEPWLARACLVEEIAQALGPANDLYGLGPSIFNDDAAHLWPTRLDFLVLRVLYAPELRSGLDRRQTLAGALAALDRLNPEGRDAPPLPDFRAGGMADWVEALRDAFDRSRKPGRRLASMNEALAIAARRAPLGAYHCRSLTAIGQARRHDPAKALAALDEAARICGLAHGAGDIRVARIRLDQARLHYRAGRPSTAWGLAEGLAAEFAAHGQEERLAALYDLQAALLATIQQTQASAEARRRAAHWRAFAFGQGG